MSGKNTNHHFFLVVGEFRYKWYELEFLESLRSLNVECRGFNIWEKSAIFKYLLKIEYYFSFLGLASVFLYAKVFLELFKLRRRDVVLFFWRPTLINNTILNIARLILNNKSIIVSYNNDNPFSIKYNQSKNLHQKLLWRKFIKTISNYDISLVYRPSNFLDYQKVGASKIVLFPPGFPDSLIGKFTDTVIHTNNVVFIGYFEKKRLECINYLIENRIDVKVYGTGWEDKLHANYKYGKVQPIYGDKYFEVLNESKICLCFLSELNSDVYTRRNFEIPACRTVMLSERTPELEDCFQENIEAVYFSNKEECLLAVEMLLNDELLMDNIRKNSFGKSIIAKYNLNGRVEKLLKDLACNDNFKKKSLSK